MKDTKYLRAEIERLEARKKELEEGENTREYDDALNESGPVIVAGIDFDPADILREMDPTAYRCGLADYNDGELTDLEDQLEDLRGDLATAEEAEKGEDRTEKDND